MKPTDEGAFQRPYPFTIDNRESPYSCPTCVKGTVYYTTRPEFINSPLEHVECDHCHEIFQLERTHGFSETE